MDVSRILRPDGTLREYRFTLPNPAQPDPTADDAVLTFTFSAPPSYTWGPDESGEHGPAFTEAGYLAQCMEQVETMVFGHAAPMTEPIEPVKVEGMDALTAHITAEHERVVSERTAQAAVEEAARIAALVADTEQ